MTISAISHYRGGTIDEVAPLARTLKAYYLKHGVAYRLSLFKPAQTPETGSSLCSTPTRRPMRRRGQFSPKIPECKQAFGEIAKFAKRISREMVIDLDL
jgi:hypothetical protein